MICNIDAEQAVLGAMLATPNGAFRLLESLSIDDFSNIHHKSLLEIIQRIVKEGGIPSYSIISPSIRGIYIDELKMSCGLYIGKLVANAVTIDDAILYATKLHEYDARRRMTSIAEQMAIIAGNPNSSVNDFNSGVMRELDEITSRLRHRKITSFSAGDIASCAVSRLEAGEKPKLIQSGLNSLDKIIGGLWRGQVGYVAARPSMGKTTLMVSMARQGAKLGTSWLIFSLEMTREALIDRLLSDTVWRQDGAVPYSRISRGDVTAYEIERLKIAAQSIRDLSIEIDDEPGLSMAEINSRSRKYAEKLARSGRRLDVIGIDHLGKIKASDRYSGNMVREIGEISNSISILCKELNVFGLIAHQLNRGNEKRENKRAEMSDMRDSGNIEQDADLILLPYRMAYYLQRIKHDDAEIDQKRLDLLDKTINVIEVNVAKNRNGPCTNIEFECHMGSNVVRDRT